MIFYKSNKLSKLPDYQKVRLNSLLRLQGFGRLGESLLRRR